MTQTQRESADGSWHDLLGATSKRRSYRRANVRCDAKLCEPDGAYLQARRLQSECSSSASRTRLWRRIGEDQSGGNFTTCHPLRIQSDVCFGSLADNAAAFPNVRFTPESEHSRRPFSCPLSAIIRTRGSFERHGDWDSVGVAQGARHETSPSTISASGVGCCRAPRLRNRCR